ncbi:MAG: hypothetical protein ACLQJ7_03245 [Syntrophobacteraceae bacterium]
MKEFAFKVLVELLPAVVPGAVLSPEPIPKADGGLVVEVAGVVEVVGVVDVVDIMSSSHSRLRAMVRIGHPSNEQE